MYLQNTINADPLKSIQDSLKAVSNSDIGVNSLSFNLNNLTSDEIIVTVLGYGIVFIALLLLFLFFSNFSKLLRSNIRKKLRTAGKEKGNKDDIISGEVSAAISLALSLHFREAHDIENTIITIKKVQSTYSPWNSKLYGLRQYPKH